MLWLFLCSGGWLELSYLKTSIPVLPILGNKRWWSIFFFPFPNSVIIWVLFQLAVLSSTIYVWYHIMQSGCIYYFRDNSFISQIMTQMIFFFFTQTRLQWCVPCNGKHQNSEVVIILISPISRENVYDDLYFEHNYYICVIQLDSTIGNLFLFPFIVMALHSSIQI